MLATRLRDFLAQLHISQHVDQLNFPRQSPAFSIALLEVRGICSPGSYWTAADVWDHVT